MYPNPLFPSDASYEYKPLHIVIVARFKYPFLCGFHTYKQSNKVAGRMIADHFLFLRSNNLTPNKTYFSEYMEDWLRDGSFTHNPSFYNKALANIANNEARHWNMPNNKFIRDQLIKLP